MTSIWKPNDTLIAKGSTAKVISSDLLNGQNWIRVRYGGQEYEGYQSEFEVKGWRKLDSLMVVAGCGCLTLVGLVVVFGAIVSSLNKVPQYQKTDSTYQQPAKDSNTGNSSFPVSSPLQRTVKQSPSPSPIQRAAKPSPSPLPVHLPKNKPVASPTLRPIRASQAGNCECPYDTDRAGRECGGRSAYSRPGGRSGAQCYTNQ